MAKRIAIVEDEAAIRENYVAAFQREGYRVDAFAARRPALDAFESRLPDLVVIDINLEDDVEGGFELCRELRARSADLPIIFLTARDSEFDAVSGLRLGADDYLTKDISLPHLMARIAALFRRLDAMQKPQGAESRDYARRSRHRYRAHDDSLAGHAGRPDLDRVLAGAFDGALPGACEEPAAADGRGAGGAR